MYGAIIQARAVAQPVLAPFVQLCYMSLVTSFLIVNVSAQISDVTDPQSETNILIEHR